MDFVEEVCKEGKFLKQIVTKDMILDIPSATISEMIKLVVEVIPKYASSHFVFDKLPLDFRVSEHQAARLAEKIQSLRIRKFEENRMKLLKNLTLLQISGDGIILKFNNKKKANKNLFEFKAVLFVIFLLFLLVFYSFHFYKKLII